MNKTVCVCVALITLLWVFISNCNGVSVEEDLTLTNDQKLKLDKFKNLMSSRLPHAYMLKDIFLIRWLRVSDFDIKEAESKLVQNLEWRKEYNIDTVTTEDWSHFEQEFPYSLEGCDIDGRPVSSANFGIWDVRKAMVSGQRDKLYRYTHKIIEEFTSIIRSAQDEGKNITQYTVLVNMDHFNLPQSGCVMCISYYISMLQSYELHYPGSGHKAILVNTPAVYQTLLASLLPFVPKRTRDLLTIYGKNRGLWQSQLSNDIPKDQLTFEFGGNSEYQAYGPEYLRNVGRLPC